MPTADRALKCRIAAVIGAAILGIVAGYLARALLPGKQEMGFFATVLLGLVGALVGFFFFTEVLGIGDLGSSTSAARSAP